MKSVGLKEVAAEAGVSVKTVSNYVNGTGAFPMSAKTAGAIRLAMRNNNFRLNTAGSGMRSHRAPERRAVFIFGYAPEEHPARIPVVPAVSALLVGLSEKLEGLGLTLTLRHVAAPENLEDWHRALMDSEVVLVYGRIDPRLLHVCERRNIPVVFLANTEVPAGAGGLSYDTVAWPSEQGVLLALARLQARGAPDTAYLSTWNVEAVRGVSWNTAADRALKLFQGAPGEKGPALWETLPDDVSPAAEIQNARQAVLAHRELHGPLALIVENDHMAMGAILAYRQLGRDPGQDVWVIGGGNFKESRYFFPSITTVAPDAQALLSTVVKQVALRLEDPSRPFETTHIPMELVGRDSG